MQTEGRHSRICEISADLAKKLDFLDGTHCSLWVGAKSVRVRLAVNPDLDSSSLALPKDVRRALSIRAGLKTNVAKAGPDLRLGPVVGVFVNPDVAARAVQGRAGFRLVELMKANRKAGCILYVFSSEDVTWSPPRVNGAYYDRCHNEWRQRSFPLPDVLYDRGGGFSSIQIPLADYIRRQLWSVPGLKKFNGQHYFDKWGQYQRLMRYSPLCRHLPETTLFTSSEDLTAMLRKHGCVYIKSTLGSNGREIMRVIAGDHGYTYNYCRTKIEAGFCPDLASLEAVIQDFLGRQRSVIQAGIDLLTYNDAKIDLRVLAARDGCGAWRIVDIPVRVGRGDCAITSTRSGSTVHQFWEFFHTALLYDDDRIRELRKSIARIVWLAVRAIEEEYGDFGELGIDLGLDKQGKIWFIEANAKPGKDTIRLAGDPKALLKAFLLPLQYCRMLAGFTDAEGRTDAVMIRALKTKAKVPKKDPGLRPHPACKRRPVSHGSSMTDRLRVPAPAVLLPPPDYATMMDGGPHSSRGPEIAKRIALDHRADDLADRDGPEILAHSADSSRQPAIEVACQCNLAPRATHACFYTGKSTAITRAISRIGTGSIIPRCFSSSTNGSSSPLWTSRPVNRLSRGVVWEVGPRVKTFRWPGMVRISDAED